MKNVIFGILGGAVGALIANFFLDQNYAIAIGALLAFLIIFGTLFSNNIKLQVDGDFIRVYRFGKLKHQFNRNTCHFQIKIVTTTDSTGPDSDCTLTVVDESDNTTDVDCSMLGRRRFERFVDYIGIDDGEPEVLPVSNKKE